MKPAVLPVLRYFAVKVFEPAVKVLNLLTDDALITNCEATKCLAVVATVSEAAIVVAPETA